MPALSPRMISRRRDFSTRDASSNNDATNGQTIITSSHATSNKYHGFCEARQELRSRRIPSLTARDTNARLSARARACTNTSKQGRVHNKTEESAESPTFAHYGRDTRPPYLFFSFHRFARCPFSSLQDTDTRAFRVRKLRTMTARLHDRDRSANR